MQKSLLSLGFIILSNTLVKSWVRQFFLYVCFIYHQFSIIHLWGVGNTLILKL